MRILQSSFRLRVAKRDFACVVTGIDSDDNIAAHIIPQSRPDVSFLTVCLRLGTAEL